MKSEFYIHMRKLARDLGWDDTDLFISSYRRSLFTPIPPNSYLKYVGKQSSQEDIKERRKREII